MQYEIRDPEKTDEYLNELLEWEFGDSTNFFNGSKNLMAIYHIDGYFKKVSRSLEQSLGFTEEELTSSPVKEFIIKDISSVVPDITSILKITMISYYFENIHCCKDGSIKWIRWRLIPDLSDEYMFIVGWDITAQRRTMMLDRVLTV